MKTKLYYFTILLLILTGAPLLADTIWTNSAGDQNYANAANWTNGVPGTIEAGVAQINPGVLGPIVNSNGNPYTWGYSIGHTGNGIAEMTLTSGDLTCSWLGLGWSDGGGAGNASGIFNMNGGILTVYDDFLIGADGNGDGTLNMTNGIIYTNRLWVGHFGGVGIINLEGGILALVVPGGGLEVNRNINGSVINIEGGELHHYGNVTQAFYDYFINPGTIIGYNGTGIVYAEYIQAGDYTRVWAEIPEPATMFLLGLGGYLLHKRK